VGTGEEESESEEVEVVVEVVVVKEVEGGGFVMASLDDETRTDSDEVA
jgi:hypothetical protein